MRFNCIKKYAPLSELWDESVELLDKTASVGLEIVTDDATLRYLDGNAKWTDKLVNKIKAGYKSRFVINFYGKGAHFMGSAVTYKKKLGHGKTFYCHTNKTLIIYLSEATFLHTCMEK